MNYSLLSKIQKSLILFTSVFSLSLFAAEDSKTWTQVSLSEDDALGANTLLALVRNINDFSDFLNGKELNATTQIMIRYPKNQPKPLVSSALEKVVDEATGKEIKTLVTTSEQISELRYIIVERDEKDSSVIQRLAILKEEIISKTKTREEETEDKGTRTVLVSSSVSYNYLPFDVDTQNLDSASSKMYRSAADNLWTKDAPAAVELPGGSKIYRVGNEATTLIRAASRRSKELKSLIVNAVESKKLELDTTSRKTVTYEKSPTGAVRNVLLVGFVKSPNEKLEAPDAVSSLAVKIDIGVKASLVKLEPEEQDTIKPEAFKTDAVKFE